MLRFKIFGLVIFLFNCISAQVNHPTLKDFNLKGRVDKCIQQSEYGSETYEFDKEGRLLRLSSLLDQNKREEIRFIYKNDKLDQKWIEVYQDNSLEKDMSYVFHFDYKENKVIEWTIRLDEESVSKTTYYYDDQLKLLNRLLSDGIEEERYDYQYLETRDSTVTRTFKNNELVERTWIKKMTSDSIEQSFTEEWSQGILLRKNSIEKNQNAQIIKEELIDYIIQSDTITSTSQRQLTYAYDENGNINNIVTSNGLISKRQNYIYQYDNHTPSNWVKRIEIPSNKYINRIITYHTEP
jgi:antitoxin component YwqK of YwqJK toxin-antitoxin module